MDLNHQIEQYEQLVTQLQDDHASYQKDIQELNETLSKKQETM